MRGTTKIAVVIPTLNEADAIGRVIAEVPSWVDDIVVADNGSTDSTADVARLHGARVVTARRRGYGSACLAGIAALDHPDVVVFLDGDYSDHPEEMGAVVDPIVQNEADLVIGSRILGACERKALTHQARFGNRLACWLMDRIWGVRFTDLGPFRAIRTSCLKQLGMSDPDFGWTVEMQVKAARQGLRTCEVPVSYRRRIGESKISGTIRGSMAAGFRILATIFQAAFDGQMSASHSSHGERLVIFTRYPAPGKVKTRLVAELGAQAAAQLHANMTRYTLATARTLASLRDAGTEVRFTGGTAAQMRSEFGAGWRYVPQGSGDLGVRLARACQDAFHDGSGSVIIIGTDCPDLSAQLIQVVFDRLCDHDVVLGPATDGGYYLVGVREPSPWLFAEMPWGTSTLFSATCKAAAERGKTVAVLPVLDDVDRPEDLPIWHTTRRGGRNPRAVTKVSVVIPTLNEVSSLESVIVPLRGVPGVEVIVADGGSCDGTPEKAAALGAQVISSRPGRARQMNAGAASASGDVLLFLHADTRVAAKDVTHITRILNRSDAVGGAFGAVIESCRADLRLVSFGMNVRSRVLRMPYGDQGLFVRSDAFHRLGGLRPLPFLEDVEFVRRLRRAGRLVILPGPIRVSGRHWKTHGAWRTALVNSLVVFLSGCGIPAGWLHRLYHRLLPRYVRRSGA